MLANNFVDPELKVEIFSKREGGQPKNGALLWKYGLDAPLILSLGVEENFMQNLSAFWRIFS